MSRSWVRFCCFPILSEKNTNNRKTINPRWWTPHGDHTLFVIRTHVIRISRLKSVKVWEYFKNKQEAEIVKRIKCRVLKICKYFWIIWLWLNCIKLFLSLAINGKTRQKAAKTALVLRSMLITCLQEVVVRDISF